MKFLRASAHPDRVRNLLCRLEEVSPLRLAIVVYIVALFTLMSFDLCFHFRPRVEMFEADEAEYIGLSTQIMSGIWEISPRRTLGFPMLVALVRSITDSLILLQLIVTALFALSTPALFALVRRLTRSNTPSTIAALLFAFWPPAIFYGTSLYSETLALPIFLTSLALLPVGSRVSSTTTTQYPLALLSGIALGVAAHVRPMYLLFLPMLLVVLLLEERRPTLAIGRFLASFVGFAILVLPWSAYMSVRFDRPIVLTANGGETLGGGLTPVLLAPAGRYTVHSGDRSAWVGPGKWLPMYENGYLTSEEQKLPYTQIDHLLQQRALSWAIEHPGDAIWLEWRKLAYMWGVYPLTANGTRQMLFGNLPTLFVLVLSLFILTTRPAARFQFARLWSLAIFVSGVALISWGSWRFRQPADAGLLAFVACGFWSRYRKSLSGEAGHLTSALRDFGGSAGVAIHNRV